MPSAFDVARWFDAVAAGAARRRSSRPSIRVGKFAVQCADIAGAPWRRSRARTRACWQRSRGAAPSTSAWLARWRPEQFVEISARQVARAQPVERLCRAASTSAACTTSRGRRTSSPGRAGVAERAVPRAADARQRPRTMRSRSPRIAGEPTADMRARRRALEGAAVARGDAAAARSAAAPPGRCIGLHRRDRRADANAAATAAARTASTSAARGRRRLLDRPHDRSRAAGARAAHRRLLHRPAGRLSRARHRAQARTPTLPIGHALLERAMVRMAAVAIIDVGERPHRGAGRRAVAVHAPGIRRAGPRAASCDERLPYPIRYRPDALLNPAVFHDAMPASTIKPIMAAAFLSDPEVGARWLAAERARACARTRCAAARQPARPADALGLRALSRSHVLRRHRTSPVRRDRGRSRRWRPRSAGTAAARRPREECGKRDLLFGARQRGRARTVARRAARARRCPTGACWPSRSAASSARRFACAATAALDPPRCAAARPVPTAAASARTTGSKCRGGAVVDVVAEGWGQGHARASALGVAGMMATLAAAANGQTEVRGAASRRRRARRSVPSGRATRCRR